MMIEMTVAGIAIDTRNSQPIVVLKENDTMRTLPIWIGIAEAKAISFALEKTKSERPLTHELLLTTIERLGYEVKQIEIDKLDSQTYSAILKLHSKEEGKTRMMIDARPSDAIALALAAKAPIFVSPEITVNAVMAADDETAEFKQFVSKLKASDFKLPGVTSVEPIEDDGQIEVDEQIKDATLSENNSAIDGDATIKNDLRNAGDDGTAPDSL
ncbi:MAG: bifunctional nuclease family protein [Candidatus Melainabacteria bacterium]|nr:bifunctional nuclease family protein [Candidatus Melainabacteria bacterium]